METVLVTGSAGFIGGHLTDKLLSKYMVIGVDNLLTGLRSTWDCHISNKNFIPAPYDINSNKLDEVFRNNKIKYVFHLAAKPGVAESVNNPVLSDITNINGTVRLLELSRKYGIERFVFSSSSSVYGGSSSLSNSEDDLPDPKSPYALQKLTGEGYCKLFSNQMNLDTVSLRYFNVIGERQRADSAYAAVLPAFSVCKSKNISPIIFGDGLQSRDFCPVESVVDANILAAEHKNILNGEVFNVARGQSISLLHLCEILDLKPPIFKDKRQGDVKHSLANIDKIRSTLGYIPVDNLEKEILKVSFYYR